MTLATAIALLLAGVLLAALSNSVPPATAALALVTPTPTLCPLATQEPLWVDPVTSPTDQFTQVVTVCLGHGEAVTVTARTGVFAVTDDFDAYFHPASVTVALLPVIMCH